MVEFNTIAERNFTKKTINNNVIICDVNNYRLSYFSDSGIIYCYYMGRYYISNEIVNLPSSEIIELIKKQCSDPYKFETSI